MTLVRNIVALSLLFCMPMYPSAQPLADEAIPSIPSVTSLESASQKNVESSVRLSQAGKSLWSKLTPCGRFWGTLAIAASSIAATSLLLKSHKSMHARVPKNHTLSLLPIGSLFLCGYVLHGKKETKRKPGEQATIWQRILPTYETLSTISMSLASGLSFVWTTVLWKPDLFKTASDSIESAVIPKKTLHDYAGEIPEPLQRFIKQTRSPEDYVALGGEPKRGCLLVGPPGNGKTTLAEVVAGSSQVPFFPISGAEVMKMLVGSGPNTLNEKFESARNAAALHESGKAIIFIDELDAIGGDRSYNEGDSESTRTLLSLLTQLQGVNDNTGVFVIAATNRADKLDPALTRSGRLGDVVWIDGPNEEARQKMFLCHWNSIKGVDLSPDNIKELTSDDHMNGYSAADIKEVVNEAALIAGDAAAKRVEKSHLDRAIAYVARLKGLWENIRASKSAIPN